MRKQQRPRVLLQRPNFLHEDLRISVLRTRSHCQTPFFSSLLGEYQGPEICNPKHRNTVAFDKAGCKFSFVLYSGPGADGSVADGGDVVMDQSISSHATADLPIASVLIQTAGDCTFGSWGDDPHKSGNDVSVHGWWTDLSPPDCPPSAYVEVWLSAAGCITGWGCFWVELDHNEQIHTAGGGAGHRTNARHPCLNSEEITFKNAVDVDLIGVGDPSGLDIRIKNVFCYPS